MELFVKKNDTFKIEVLAYESNGDIEATTVPEDVPPNKEVKSINFTFKRPAHIDSTTLMSNAKVMLDNEQTSFDAIKLQDQALKILLYEWDIKGSDEKIVPVTETNINNLHPQIARAAALGCLSKINL